MAKVWDKPITAETDWGGDASTDNLPVSGRQVQAWIKGNIKSDAQISQLLVSWLNTHTINSPVFWKGLPIDADSLSWDGDKLTVIGSDGESQPIDEQFLINFLQENGYLTKGDYPFVYDAEKKAWLFTGDLVATGAITMFGDFNKFKPSTIMDAVQVDDITIGKTAEGVLYAKSGGGSGGSGISYEEINQIVSNAIQNKADKATTLEGYGIEDAYDKSYIDTLAYKLTTVYNWGDHSKAGYVFKDTKQDISARHNFSDGLRIGGITIRKSQDGTVYIDGNLVIKGAMTMFGTDATIPSSIWASIPFDSTMKWDGSKWSVVGGSGSGSVDDSRVNALISEYLTKNSYATQSWVQGQGYLTTHQSLSHLLTKTDAANTYQTIINSTNKIAYSNISGTPDLSAYALKTAIPSLSGYATEQWVGDNYLAKSGGAIEGVLELNSTNAARSIRFNTTSGSSWLFVNSGEWYVTNIGWGAEYKLVHSNNIGDYALLTSGGSVSSDDYQPLIVNSNFSSGIEDVRIAIAHNWNVKGLFNWESNGVGLRMYNTTCGSAIGIKDDGTPYYDSYILIHSGNIGSYNAGSATKLATPRTIWGQSFDGSKDISGLLTDVAGIRGSTTDGGYIGDRNKGIGATDGGSMIYNYSASPITFHINGSERMRITDGGNIAIGVTTADYKFYVHGIGAFKDGVWAQGICLQNTDEINSYGSLGGSGNGSLYLNFRSSGLVSLAYGGGNVAIGRTSADAKLHVGGDIIADGAITMFSQLSMKNVLDYDGLSLAQLAQIKPARFTWKDRRDSLVHVGGIADEVMKILPEVIYHTSDDKLTMDYGSAAFYVGASLIKPVIDHEKRIADLENENKRKDEIIISLQNQLKQLIA